MKTKNPKNTCVVPTAMVVVLVSASCFGQVGTVENNYRSNASTSRQPTRESLRQDRSTIGMPAYIYRLASVTEPTQEEPNPFPVPNQDINSNIDQANAPDAMQEMADGKAKANDLSLPYGEPVKLRVPSEIGKYRRYVASRDRMLIVTTPAVAPEEDAVDDNIQFLNVTGFGFGDVELTLIGEANKSASFRVNVVPSLKHIETLLARQFPNTNLKIEMAADKIIMVDGVVDSVAEVEPITSLLRNLVGKDGKVINGLRIGGVMQVQLDVVVASVNRTKARELGFNFQQGSGKQYLGSQLTNIMASPSITTAGSGTVLPSAGAAAGAASLTNAPEVFFGIAQQASPFYGYLKALEDNGCVKILANPSLVTLSGRPATFLVGGQQPFQIPNGLGTTGIQFKPFGTSLIFTPLVLGQGKIRLEMRPEVSSPNDTGGFTVQELFATVEMESEQSLVLGGLLQTRTDSSIKKVPFLGDLPLVGMLFRRVREIDQETELMIMATPKFVNAAEPCQRPDHFPGDETRSPSDHELYLRGRPEMPSDCSNTPGARNALNSHQPMLPSPYQTWEPKDTNGDRREQLPAPVLNRVPLPDKNAQSSLRIERPLDVGGKFNGPAAPQSSYVLAPIVGGPSQQAVKPQYQTVQASAQLPLQNGSHNAPQYGTQNTFQKLPQDGKQISRQNAPNKNLLRTP